MAQIDIPSTVQEHPDYKGAQIPLKTVRDCVEGEWKIKSEGTLYLEHPSDTDQTSKEALQRYKRYKSKAEYLDYVNTTLRGWLGKMRIGSTSIKTPTKIEYLLQNADGDGTPLTSAIEHAASNVYQAKFHIGVVDYKGLQGVPLRTLSTAQVRQLNPRATIKQYDRESLVDWDFRRINGVMQLAYMKLREQSYDFDPKDNTRVKVTTDIELALDQNGDYYQKKTVGGQEGEESYVTVSGKRLKWIPAVIFSDSPLPVGALPRAMGMLYPICELAIERYNVNADYKEAMRYLVPTTFTSGWKHGDKEIFNEVNGRDHMEWGPGSANNLPNEVSVDIKSVETKLEHFNTYFEENLEQVRTLGGIIKTGADSNKTATEADIDSAEINAALESVAEQQESGWKRLIAYCGMFEGLWKPEAVEDNLDEIVVDLPRDFATPKLSVEEVAEIRNLYIEGVYSKEQVVTRLSQGGWGTGEEIDVWLSKLDEAGPSLSSLVNQLPRQPQPQEPEETE